MEIIMDIPKNSKEAELIYKDTKERTLSLLFLPPTEKKFDAAPIYFLIPGGGWHSESKNDMYDFSKISAEALRKRGFAVVSIDYRVCGGGVVMDDILSDCFNAVSYIAHFADVLELDKNKFVMSGHSAGGHLALMLSYADKNKYSAGYEFNDDYKVIAAAAFSPVANIFDLSKHNLRDVSDVFKDTLSSEKMKECSPITHVSPKCPPTLLCAGTCDYLVFPTSSAQLYDKLRENNVPCEITYSVGGGHCFEEVLKELTPSPSFDEIQNIAAKFIYKQL